MENQDNKTKSLVYFWDELSAWERSGFSVNVSVLLGERLSSTEDQKKGQVSRLVLGFSAWALLTFRAGSFRAGSFWFEGRRDAVVGAEMFSRMSGLHPLDGSSTLRPSHNSLQTWLRVHGCSPLVEGVRVALDRPRSTLGFSYQLCKARSLYQSIWKGIL